MSIDPANASEKFTITVSGANGSTYRVMFVNPRYDPNNKRSKQTYKSLTVSDNDSASKKQRRFASYFRQVWGTEIAVSMVKYDADDIKTDDSSLAVKTVYTVELLK